MSVAGSSYLQLAALNVQPWLYPSALQYPYHGRGEYFTEDTDLFFNFLSPFFI
jgi:hypothetical protein